MGAVLVIKARHCQCEGPEHIERGQLDVVRRYLIKHLSFLLSACFFCVGAAPPPEADLKVEARDSVVAETTTVWPKDLNFRADNAVFRRQTALISLKMRLSSRKIGARTFS